MSNVHHVRLEISYLITYLSIVKVLNVILEITTGLVKCQCFSCNVEKSREINCLGFVAFVSNGDEKKSFNQILNCEDNL